jgi:hypothetical protein
MVLKLELGKKGRELERKRGRGRGGEGRGGELEEKVENRKRGRLEK